MEFLISSVIDRPVAEVFAFLRDIDRHPREPGSVVPVYDKLSPGPAAVGTRYLEVVRMMPGLKWQVVSEIEVFRPPEELSLRWHGRGMRGLVRYHLRAMDQSTSLLQQQTIHLAGPLRLLSPLVRVLFKRSLAARMMAIKDTLDRQGWPDVEPTSAG